MNKIQSRDYTVKEKGTLKPTDLGKVIAQMLETNFGLIMNVNFTASMEDDLELIEENKREWKDLIHRFWDTFIPLVETAEKEAFVPKEETDMDCPSCGAKLQKIWAKGRFFYGCSRYPDCKFTSSIETLHFDKTAYSPHFDWDQPCPQCGSPMQIRHGKFGAFLGCTRYPECRGLVNIPKAGEEVPNEADLPTCPAIGCDGKLTPRRSRFGKLFYSCSNFPDCDVIINKLEDLAEKYPNHPKTPYVRKMKKGGKRVGAEKKKSAAKSPKTKGASRSKTTGKTLSVSPELAKIIGRPEATRGEVTKLVWEYIKEHHLQDPQNKRLIRPDALLAQVLHTQEPVDMFKMTSLLQSHFKSS